MEGKELGTGSVRFHNEKLEGEPPEISVIILRKIKFAGGMGPCSTSS